MTLLYKTLGKGLILSGSNVHHFALCMNSTRVVLICELLKKRKGGAVQKTAKIRSKLLSVC